MNDLWDTLWDLSKDYEIPDTEYLTYEFTEKVFEILENIVANNPDFQYRMVDIPWRDNMGGIVVLSWIDGKEMLHQMDWEYMYYEKGEDVE